MPVTINNNGVVFPDDSLQRRAIPAGAVIMWYGDILNPPPGWTVMDGTSGVTDVTGRFVVGAGSSYAMHAIGGTDAVTLSTPQIPVHSHTDVSSSISTDGAHSHPASSSTDGSHSHPFAPSGALRLNPAIPFGVGPGRVQPTSIGTANPHSHTAAALDAAGDHTHPMTITLGNSGGGDSHSNLPEFFALVFLVKD